MRIFFSFCLLSLFLTTLSGQSRDTIFPQLSIGEWQQHLPWQSGISVTNGIDDVYYATDWAVVAIDKEEFTSRYITKTEGLSDVGIRLVRFQRSSKVLFIAYSNSNIDLYYPEEDRVVNLPFILKNTVLSGDKTIYDVVFEGNFAYITTGFGVIKFDIGRQEVDFTVFTDVPVRSFALYQGFYYAGTTEGLYRVTENDDNPADFSRWELMGVTQGMPTGEPVQAMAVFKDILYLGVGTKGMYSWENNKAIFFAKEGDQSVTFLRTGTAGLLSGWRKGGDPGKIMYLDESGSFYEVQGNCDATRSKEAVEDGNRLFWFADEFEEYRYYDASTGTCKRLRFNSPYSHHCAEISIRDGKVFVATLGADQNLNAVYGAFGLYVRNTDGRWSRISGESNPELQPNDCDRAWWRVAAHPDMDKVYVGSFAGGLVEMNDMATETRCFNKSNSILTSAGAAGENRTAIGALAFDDDNNLWMNNYGSTRPIAVLTAEGELANFNSPISTFIQMAIDRNGYKWFAGAFGGGLVVYDSGNDIKSNSDDRIRQISSSNSVLETNNIGSVAVDLDGDVWVGTDAGLYSFECGSNIFSNTSPCKGTRQIITVDGFSGYLLQDENIRCIAVDGANQKWVGTTNGIFVQSPDGRTTLARYTATNSPLFSNTITDIAIDGKTGEVWIGTSAGLVSLRAIATDGGKVNLPSTYAYPNPVRPDYDGPIAIYGLATDANIKITDIAGNLVYEGTALGGQAVWNGRDYLGRKAASGVYLIYATGTANFEQPDTIITKVVILN